MAETKENRRVRMTKRMLREALLELMEEKSVGRITTTELCAAADINRNTFYAHYSAPEDVLREIEDEIAGEAVRAIEEEPVDNVLLSLLRYAYRNQKTCRILLASPDSRLRERLRVPLTKLNEREWAGRRPGSDVWAKSFLTFVSAGSIALATQWLEEGCRIPPEQLDDTMRRLTIHGANGYESGDA